MPALNVTKVNFRLFEFNDEQLPQIKFANMRKWQTVNDLKAFLESVDLLSDEVDQRCQALVFQCLVTVLIESGKAGICLFFTRSYVMAIELQKA